jgi:hypothetical protein
VKVSDSKGIANHTVPESCAVYREVQCEALTGVRVGQPLSRERFVFQGADVVGSTEGNTYRCDTASTWTALRGRRPWHARTLLVREPGDLLVDHFTYGVVCIGKARSRSR